MQSRFAAAVALGTLVVLASGCSDSPTVTPPPVTVNTPPTIDSVTVATDRVEADRPVQVAAVVRDVESQIGALTYTWSASPQVGTFGAITSFVGSQATNSWRPLKGQTTPDLYTVMLTVTESYSSAGQAKQNVVSKSASAVHYNDSPAETVELGYDFIVRKFGNYNISPAEAVSNFSNSCPGKAAEQEQIEENRENFQIISASYPSPIPTFNTAMTEGSVEGRCTFEDIPKSGPNAGKREFVNGTCLLTTVYENFRWYLCDSYFNPPFITTPAGARGRFPGRPYPTR